MARHVSMDLLTTVLEVIGAALIVAGLFVWWPPAALIVAGAMCIGVGWLLAPAPRGGPR